MYHYPPELIDYSAMTHIIHFAVGVSTTPPYLSVLVSPSDSANWETVGTGRNMLKALIDSSHAHGVKVLLSIANVNTYGGDNTVMTYVTSDSARCRLWVNSTLEYCRRKGYDGIDINWEWPNNADEPGYTRMMKFFREGLNQWPVRGELSHALYPTAGFGTGATIRGPYNIPLLNEYVDQHNVELYGLQAWQTNLHLGYTSAIQKGTVEASGGVYDAITYADPTNSYGQNVGPLGLARGGWDKSKIGVSVGFLYWHMQSANPMPIGGSNVGNWMNFTRSWYSDVIGTKSDQFGMYPRQWDDNAKAPYKRWQDANGYHFLTYEDSQSVAAKAQWIKDNGFGGMMIFELGAGYITTDSRYAWSVPGYTGVKDPLLQAVKNVFGTTTTPPIPVPDTVAPDVRLLTPSQGDTVTGTVQLSADASDNVRLSSVRFFMDGSPVGGTLTTVPFSVQWSPAAVSEGFHTISVIAADAAGLSSADSASVFVYHPPVPVDSIPPTVSVTAPAGGSTVSGVVSVEVRANDNLSLAGVRIFVDGSAILAEKTAAPFSFAWNSASVPNGTHLITAEARDASGFRSRDSVTVTVANDTTAPAPTAVAIYQDDLMSPWQDISWSSTINMHDSSEVFQGKYSMKATQSAWGAVGLRSGTWSQPVNVDFGNSESFSFAVYHQSGSLSMNVYMANDQGETFPTVIRGNIPTGTWETISIPVNQLNPDGRTVHAIYIQNYTNATVDYSLDAVELTGGTAVQTVLAAPTPVAPLNGAMDQSIDVSLEWEADPSAVSYMLRVATDPGMGNLLVDESTIGQNFYAPGGLNAATTYYWQVGTITAGGTSPFSATQAFTTADTAAVIEPVVTAEALKFDRLFVDFGKVAIGDEKEDSVTISNESDTLRTITDLRISSSTGGNFSARMNKSSIGPKSKEKIFIKYSPKKRSLDQDLVITFADSPEGTDTVRVTGRGVNPPKGKRSRGSVVLVPDPNQGAVSDTFSVTNIGELDLDLTSVSSTSQVFSVEPGYAVIAPGEVAKFTVTASAGDESNTSAYIVLREAGDHSVDSVRVSLEMNDGGTVPGGFVLEQNYPNPFNPTTDIAFRLPVASLVTIDIYNALGMAVNRFELGEQDAGTGSIEWDARNASGEVVPSGVYFYRITAVGDIAGAPRFSAVKKMILMR